MKSTRSSLASRYSVAFILCLSCSMILMASALSVSPSSSLGSSSMASSARVEASAMPRSGEPIANVLASSPTPFVPNTTVTATKSHTPSGNRAPGDSLFYTVVITNTGAQDAMGVNFTDTIDPNTTFVGSLDVSPIAVNDTYNTIGNVDISVPAPGLLANDLNPGGVGSLVFTDINGSGFFSGAAVATSQMGTVNVFSGGSFTYNPKAGFTGTDTFTYTINNGTGLTDSATVTITVSDQIWFVNSALGSNGDGRRATPFNVLTGATSADAVDGANDAIFLFSSATNYTGGLTLNNGEKVIGQGASQTILAITGFSTPSGTNLLPSTGLTNPVITTSGTTAITLNSSNGSNGLHGFTVGDTGAAGTDIAGSNFGNLTVKGVSLTGTGEAMNLFTGTIVSGSTFGTVESNGGGALGMQLSIVGGGFTITTTNMVNPTGNGIDVQNSPSGSSFSFGSTTVNKSSTAGTGVKLATNTGATFTFSSLTVTTSNGPGVDASSSGTVTVSGGSITSTGGPALDVDPTALAMTFSTVSSTNSSGTGISLIGVSGSLTIGGTTIATPTGIGISVDTSSATLAFNGTTSVTNSGGTAVSLTTNTGTISFGTLNITNTTSNKAGLVGTNNTNTITTTSGVINTGTGGAVNITRTTGKTPLNITLTTVSSSGGSANGITISNSTSDSTGSFTITGTGTAASGGTIATKTGADGSGTQGSGIFLNNASNVSLDRMQLNGFQNYGIRGTNVTGFTLDNTIINGTNGTTAAGGSEEGAVRFDNLLGSASISNSTLGGVGAGNSSFSDDLRVTNTSGTLNRLTVTNVHFGDIGSGGTNGMTFSALNNGTVMNGTVTDSFFTNAIGTVADFTFSNNSTMDLVFRRNKLSNNNVNQSSGGGGFVLQGGTGASTVTYDISCNKIQDSIGIALLVAKGNGSGTIVGDIINNKIGLTGQSLSGSTQGSGIKVKATGSGTHTVLIRDNDVRQYNENGIFIQNNDGSATLNATVFHNTTAEGGPFTLSGLDVDIGALGTDTSICNVVAGSAGTAGDKNDFSNGDPANGCDVNLSQIAGAGTQLNLSKNGSGSGTAAAVIDDDNLNPGTTNTCVAVITLTLVTTLPATPPAVASCVQPASVDPNLEIASVKPIEDQNDTTTIDDILRAAPGQRPKDDSVEKLRQEELTWMVQAAIARWAETGMSAEDLARLQAATLEITDLPDGQIATSALSHIKIDDTAAGYGWYFDQFPSDDNEFAVPVIGREFQTTEHSPANGKMDLLTVVMRELGSVYLQGKKRIPIEVRPLMESTLSPSVRRLPDPSLVQLAPPQSEIQSAPQAAPSGSAASSPAPGSSSGGGSGAVNTSKKVSPQTAPFPPGPVSLGNIPIGEKITLKFQVTINNPLPAGVCSVTNPAPGSGANVTGSNFSDVTITGDAATIVTPITIGSCPAHIDKFTDMDACTAVATFTTPTADGCPVPTVACVPASGSAFPKGTTTVTCTASNAPGPADDATCSFTVTVTDNQAPVLTGCTNITTNTAAGLCTAAPTYTPTATDNCDSSRPVTCIPASGSTFSKGVTTVTCSASDLATPTANTGMCTFTVTVNDNQAPVITGCTNIMTNTAPGVCTAAPTYAPTATDNCDGVRPVTCMPASGSTFNKGVTTVSCSASDLNTPMANTGTCTFTVTVNDNQAPVFSGCTDIMTNTAPGVCTAAPTFTPTATDNCDGSRPVTCMPASGTTFNKGVTTVTCSASDLATPTANTGMCSFTVTVNDNQPPVLTGCTNQTINAGAGVCYATATYTVTATDNCDGVRPVSCVPASGASFAKGVTTVSCSASDLNAPPNTGMCTFTITVNDTQPPVVTCPPSGGAFAASDCLPSQSSAYTGATLYSVGPNTVTNVVLSNFTPCTPPPVSGMATINFTGVLTGDYSTGGPPVHFQAPVTGSMKVTFINLTVATRTFDTEMLQLDISGGNLPAGVQLRESPTLASTGQTKITTVTGGFHIDSFFDVFTELTTNGGLIWTPDPTARHISAVQSTDAGACNAVVNYPAATATDNCDVVTPTCTPASGTTFSKGVTTVSCSVSDTSGNPGVCSFTVTVLDTQLPTLTCPNNINVIGNTCQNVSYATPVPSDNCPSPTVLCAPLAGTCFAVGTTTVTCTATDMSGNTGSCSFTVTVTPCTITCPNNVSVDAEPGMCSAIATFDPPTTTGSCGTVTCVPASGSPFQKGVTTVTCSTTAGPSCAFTVTVNDTQPPMITCPAPIIQSTDSGVCTAVVTFTPTATDNCPLGPTPIVCSPASGATFPKGVTTVMCTATDVSLNTAQCSFTVTIKDTQAPVLTGCTNVSAFTALNSCDAVVTYTQPTATDNCDGARPVTCSPASGSTFPKGVTTVNCSASDANSPTVNTGTCSFTVTVTDNVAPVMSGCTNVSAFTAANSCNAVVTYTQPTANDNCDGSRTVTCNPASGTTFNKGVTTVSCSASDTSGNPANCTFTVTVTDNVAPVFSGCTNVNANTASNACNAVVTYTQPTANDNCDGSRTVTCNPVSGTTFSKGVTTVSCSASDTSGNPANCTFTVTVTDNVAPVLSGCNNVSANTASNACTAVVTYTQPTANDNCDGARTVTCNPASGTTFNKGVTTVSCSATDTSSQTGTCTFTVTVTDVTAPSIACPSNVTHGTDPGVCTAVVTYANATATDNCPGVGTPVCTPASGTTFQKGVTTVSCTVSDTSSNSASCTFTVTVNDTQNPTVTCPANITFTTPGFNDACGTVTYATPSGSDNCPLGPNPVSCSPASGMCFAVGVTTVTCTATDTSGNQGTCTFKITVQNPCTITCPANITKNNDANVCGAVVTFAPTTTGGGCGTVTCSPASGAVFPKGTTTVTCTTSGPSCSFTVTVNDTQPPAITCPANVTHGTDPNVCQAVVTYPAPVVSDNCPGVGAPTCSPASGTTFPKGTTTITCTVKDSSNNMSMCSFLVTVNDTQPPVFPNGCPAGITKAAQATCPITTTLLVTYTTPVATDNCGPAPTVVCNPPSGGVFPPGTTVVTCTATDSSGNTAICTFPVNVFSFCLQDDSSAGNVVFVNAVTGDYLFCQNGVPIASGTGTLVLHGCNFQIDHTKGDRKVHIQGDTSANSGAGVGTAFISKSSGPMIVQITDRKMTGDACTCSP